MLNILYLLVLWTVLPIEQEIGNFTLSQQRAENISEMDVDPEYNSSNQEISTSSFSSINIQNSITIENADDEMEEFIIEDFED